jgi:transcriptional regulator with XRE-family HTH domain
MSSPIVIKFGKRVRQLREERGISQERLGILTEIDRTYIGMIERGERNITLPKAERIAKALNSKLSHLLD